MADKFLKMVLMLTTTTCNCTHDATKYQENQHILPPPQENGVLNSDYNILWYRTAYKSRNVRAVYCTKC